MMIYFFYNKNLKRLVCVKIATYEKFDMDEDEDEEEDHGDDDDWCCSYKLKAFAFWNV